MFQTALLALSAFIAGIESSIEYRLGYLDQSRAPWLAWSRQGLSVSNSSCLIACSTLCEDGVGRGRGRCNAFRVVEAADDVTSTSTSTSSCACEGAFIGHDTITDEPGNNSITVYFTTHKKEDAHMMLLYDRDRFYGYNADGECEVFPDDVIDPYPNADINEKHAVSSFAVHTYLYCEGSTPLCFYMDLRFRPFVWKGPVNTTSAKYYSTMVSVGSKIYIIGGQPQPVVSEHPIEVFDVETKSMEPFLDLSTGDPVNVVPNNLRHACSILLDKDNIVVTGGEQVNVPQQINLVTRQITDWPPLLTSRYVHACGKISWFGAGFLIVAGGRTTASPHAELNDLEYIDVLLRDRWLLSSYKLPWPAHTRSGTVVNLGAERHIVYLMYDRPIYYIRVDGTGGEVVAGNLVRYGHSTLVPANLFSGCSLF